MAKNESNNPGNAPDAGRTTAPKTPPSPSFMDVRDCIAVNTNMARTLVHMLHDLTGGDDNLSDDLDVNDPASRAQRVFACLDALQDRLDAIGRAEQMLAGLQKELSHG